METIRKSGRKETPGATGIHSSRAEQRCSIEDPNCGIGVRQTGQCQSLVIGNSVAESAAVDRERSDGGRGRNWYIYRYRNNCRGRTSVTGSVGRRCGQVMGAVVQ